ncbi:ASCH domain-containing protein [Fusobacterium polymorphum]|uniref:ASCH domain-containing protein n=1 Tax=Fusobacterium nucleatum subsp. polymorphum TaxID=76857 RepID=UPI002B4BAC40|nr:ASCH domain-containing protein [Fusobacterium polymorphum]WRL70397.1 ASCH domain-containing protein [Fusobacterium polymorphum]
MKNNKSEEIKILLSIQPQFVESILNGTKKFEYRKIVPKKEPKRIVIYSTAPISKIIGEVDVEQILIKSLKELWEETKEFSGISKVFFDKYFKNKKQGLAYKLGKVIIYESPRTLDSIGIKTAPQSYVYIK